MRVGLTSFRVVLAVGWVVVAALAIRAAWRLGLGSAFTIFFNDFSNPWRAQFYTDFTLHLLLVGAWMIYRARLWPVGLICALLALNLGSMFTLAYLLVVSFQAKGDFRKILLGARVPADWA